MDRQVKLDIIDSVHGCCSAASHVYRNQHLPKEKKHGQGQRNGQQWSSCAESLSNPKRNFRLRRKCPHNTTSCSKSTEHSAAIKWKRVLQVAEGKMPQRITLEAGAPVPSLLAVAQSAARAEGSNVPNITPIQKVEPKPPVKTNQPPNTK